MSFRITPKDPRFKHKVHPNLSKKAFEEEDLLTVRSPSHRFSLYRPIPLLKWQLKSNNPDSLPVSLFSSATHSTHGTRFVLDMELKHNDVVIEDIRISFPSSGIPPSNVNVDIGEAIFCNTQLLWQVPALNANDRKGRIEFCVAADAMPMAPVAFEAFSRTHVLKPIEILECYTQETEERIEFECETIQTYSIVLKQS